MWKDPCKDVRNSNFSLYLWSKALGESMDELKIRRMKKCAESPEGHNFGKPVDNVVTCENCDLSIEELAQTLGAVD